MEFQHSEKALHWQERVRRFLDDKVLPREAEYWAQVREDSTRQPPAMDQMKASETAAQGAPDALAQAMLQQGPGQPQ